MESTSSTGDGERRIHTVNGIPIIIGEVSPENPFAFRCSVAGIEFELPIEVVTFLEKVEQMVDKLDQHPTLFGDPS